MNSNHENDAFELRFEDAVNDMHHRTDRGGQPSAHVWTSIRSQIGTQAETADPRANGPDRMVEQSTVQRSRAMDAALSPREFGYKENRSTRFGWMTLLAAGLVGIMIFTSVWMNGSTPSPDDGNDLAWAPGMGTVESSPVASNACTLEPLTTDEVMSTVFNPNQGYIRLGKVQVANSESMWEPENGYLLNMMPGDPRSTADAELAIFEPATGETASDIETLGDQFWTCLQEGSAFQVWGVLDPILVQHMILDRFPVIRSEADLRGYIEEQGPKPFVELDANRFSAYSMFSSAQEAEAVDSFVFRPDNDLAYPIYARVHFTTTDESSFVYLLFMSEIAPDVWVIYEMTPQTE